MRSKTRPFFPNVFSVFILIPLFVLVIMKCAPSAIHASEAEAAGEAEWAARVVSVEGSVEARKGSETTWSPVRLDDTYHEGDMIRVGELSRAAVLLQNGSVLRLDQNTVITFAGVEREETLLLKVIGGSIHFFSRKPKKLKVITPFMNAAVGGTEFIIKVDSGGSSVSVLEGTVTTENEVGSLTLTSGQSALARKGMAPEPFTVVRPRDAVHWAIYYPPVLDLQPGELALGREREWPAAVERSLERYWKNDIAGAFSYLPKESDCISDPRFYTYRAALLLTVGRVHEANADISRALEIEPRHASAFALQSIVAVAQNEKGKALELARKSVEMDPGSSGAHVALSYAQQAHFDLKSAQASLLKAVQLNPGNPLAWARLAELRLSTGDLDGAMDAAQQAATLNPNLARTQTVLGFAHLTRIDLPHAKKSFHEAIRLGQGDPLPRLGLGLAMIREGHLEQGRKEMEIAVVLDPNNSLVRSYLGKAYYEEKSNRRAKEQFQIAKELDPMDPTPWFYDAIRKQTVNRPVEALGDLQRSIALNDNRAVYRSRLLLDEDLAARSVSLARIYDDLGFHWLALSEGSRSLELDPADFSAHRFLADSYFSLPRHEIARVSELLQSQLLQPISIMPIQPQLSESKFLPLSGAGPRDPSFNEYTPLFTRNQMALLLTGLAGERGTLADDAVQSGILGRFSYSLGQSHFESDGFRTNDDQKQDIYTAFTQVSLSPKTSVLAEYRHKDREFGDLQLLFDPDAFDPLERQQQERDTFRLGFHHAFAPGSDLIGSFQYQMNNSEFHASDLDFASGEKGYGTEFQHIYRSQVFNLILGAGHFRRSEDDVTAFSGFSFQDQFKTKHTDAYLYSHLSYPKDVVWTLGVSGDFFEGGSLKLDVTQVNPKFGVTWKPFPGTTLRGAVFRSFKRTLLTDQTVEPTQVAGFNQFFDDGEGTDAWRYGMGLDQKITDRLFGGVELSKRDMTVPTTSFFTGEVTTSDAEEVLGRAYLYWTPHRWLALGPEYQYEQTEFGPELPAFGIARLETHRVGLNVGFFHPSGILARLRPAFVSQSSDFRLFPFDPAVPGHSDFFVLDASIGYRLPRRLGVIEITAKNLFDQSFRFQNSDPTNPQITPRRFIAGRLNLSF